MAVGSLLVTVAAYHYKARCENRMGMHIKYYKYWLRLMIGYVSLMVLGMALLEWVGRWLFSFL